MKSSAPVVKAAPAAPSVPAPAITSVSSQRRSDSDNDVLPIAGAVGLGVLALGGAAFAFGRRRRNGDETTAYATENEVAASSEPRSTAAYAPRMDMPVVAAATAGGARQLPNGFDLSRFGRHTQAAYRGPTADNPSHSLRRRLKRASFLDQREREAGEAGQVRQPREPIYAAAGAQPAQEGQVTVRLAPQRSANRFGYVLQK